MTSSPGKTPHDTHRLFATPSDWKPYEHICLADGGSFIRLNNGTAEFTLKRNPMWDHMARRVAEAQSANSGREFVLVIVAETHPRLALALYAEGFREPSENGWALFIATQQSPLLDDFFEGMTAPLKASQSN